MKGIAMTLFRQLGPFSTTAIGHGEMPLTIENNRGHEVGIETLHASLDAGCRHIDTAWAYYCSGGEEQTGEKAELKSIGGGTYAKSMPNLVAFGPIFPGDEVREHKPDEYMEIERVLQNAEIIAAAMYELTK